MAVTHSPRSVLITGASSGIGHALAEAYLQRGAGVYAIHRRKVADLAQSERYREQIADLSLLDRIPDAVTELLQGLSNLDLVILNAGILGSLRDISDSSLTELQRVMDVNVWANKAVLDTLFSLSIPVGQVVTMSSGAAVRAERGWGGYSISKAALNMLTALYAAERTETHFSALAPGIVDTAMQEAISSLPSDPRYPSLQFLRSARGTPAMPQPRQAATKLVRAIERAIKYDSGSFLDADRL